MGWQVYARRWGVIITIYGIFIRYPDLCTWLPACTEIWKSRDPCIIDESDKTKESVVQYSMY